MLKNMRAREKIILVIEALFVTFAYNFTNSIIDVEPKIARILFNYNNLYGIQGLLTFSISIAILYKIKSIVKEKNNKRLTIISSVVGTLFSSIMVFGRSLYYLNSFELVFLDRYQVIISLLDFTGFFIIFYNLFKLLITYLENNQINVERKNNVEKISNAEENSKKKKIIEKVRKHPVLIIAIMLLVFWLPYIIIYFPGTLNVDSLFEIEQFYGEIRWTTHHPVIPTIIFGLFMKLGQLLKIDNLGIFLFTFLQTIIGAITLSWCIYGAYQYSLDKKIFNTIFWYFSFVAN